LPVPTPININTATPVVLQALHQELDESDIEQLIASRDETAFTDLKEFLAHDSLAGLELAVTTDIKTDWFSVLTDVSVGRGRARLESILFRGANKPQIVSRTRTAKRIPDDENGDEE
jgi:general secretion pathway protein K